MALTTISPALQDTQAQYTGFKNRIINGAMMIDQRNAGAAITANNGVYPADRFIVGASQTSKLNTSQKNGVDSGASNYEAGSSPSNFINSIKFSSASSYSSLATDYFLVSQRIEGTNVSDLGFGTINAKTVTLSFWVKSSIAGTFAGALSNSDNTRAYPFTYTIASANTWEQKSITVAGDTTGTWVTNNGIGLQVRFNLGCGSNFNGTAGSWQTGAYYTVAGTVSLVGTNAATWYITGVQLEKGSTATSFDYRPYGTELALCKRYTHVIGNGNTGSGIFAVAGVNRSASATWFSIPLPAPMRATPSFSITNNGTVRISCKTVEVNSSANSTTVGGASPDFTYDNSTDGDLSISYQNVSGTSPSVGSVDTGMQFSYGRFIFSAEL